MTPITLSDGRTLVLERQIEITQIEVMLASGYGHTGKPLPMNRRRALMARAEELRTEIDAILAAEKKGAE